MSSSSSKSENFVVKSFLIVGERESDIRRFKLETSTFKELDNVLRASYKNQDFVVKYKDEEDELITIASDADMQEAWSSARTQKGKLLKIYLFPLESVKPLEQAKAAESSKPAPAKPSGAQPASKGPTSMPPPQSSAANEEVGEIAPMLRELLSDPEIRQILPHVFQTVYSALSAGENAQSAIDTVFAHFPQIRDHRAMTQLIPLLPAYMDVLEQARVRLMSNSQLFAMVGIFGPQFIANLASQGGDMDGLAQMFSQMGGGAGAGAGGFPGFPGGLFSAFQNQAPPSSSSSSSTSSSSSASSSSGSSNSSSSEVHVGISCDSCGISPITGSRYKCSVCPDFDLCGNCESENSHPESHPLLKMQVNGGGGGRFSGPHGSGFPHGPHPHFPHGSHPHGPPGFSPHGPHGHGPHGFPPGFPFRGMWGGRGGGGRGHSHWRRAMAMREAAMANGMGPFGPMGMGPFGGQSGSDSAPGSGASSRAPSTERGAEFVQHKSYPNNTYVPCHQTLVKTWEVKNIGTNAWPEGTKLIYVKGTLPSTENEYEVPQVQPGLAVDVSALVQTPQFPGRYQAEFRLGNPKNKDDFFGPTLTCDLIVVDVDGPQNAEASLEAKVQQLVAMGFSNVEQNARLLREHNLDVERVCLALLEQLK